MKIIFLILYVGNAFGQDATFQLSKIEFDGLPFYTNKQLIEGKFGTGEIDTPRYECGFFTDDQPGGPYHQLVYSGFNYIGSVSEKFLLESVNFELCKDHQLKYDGVVLNAQTTQEIFSKIFGKYASDHFKEHPDNDGIILMVPDNDDGARFTFKNGKLVQFEYWSSC